MNKRFLVISNWIDKVSGEPKSNLVPINEGIGKESGNPYQISDTDSATTIEGSYPVGAILQSTITFNANAPVVDNTPAVPQPAPRPATPQPVPRPPAPKSTRA